MPQTAKRVLIVEDEGLVSMMMEEFLEELGYAVVATAARLDDALEKARTVPLDVAVLDLNLAGELSYPVADMLRARHIPFVVATGYGTLGLPSRLSDVTVLSKPFRQEQLANALCAVQGP